MEHLRFHPLNLRQEAAAVLSRLAYRGDNERSGDVRVSIDYYCKKYNVEPGRFAGILDAYEYVKANLVCEEQELLVLFGVPDGTRSCFESGVRRGCGGWRVGPDGGRAPGVDGLVSSHSYFPGSPRANRRCCPPS